MNTERPYIFRLLISLVFIILLSSTSYTIISKSMFRQYPVSKKYKEIFEGKEKFDLLLMGSSRMKNHVNPKVIDSILGIKSFNIGTGGANIIEFKALLESYLINHNPPSMIVLSLDLFSLNTNSGLAFYPLYIPYRHVKFIRKELQAEGVRVKLYDAIPFLSIMELDDYYRGAVIKLLMKHKELRNGDFYYRGYESNTGDTLNVNELPFAYKKSPIQVTQKGKLLLEDLIRICRDYKVELVFIYAPEYNQLSRQRTTNYADIMHYYDSLAKAHHISFLRHDLLPLCKQPSLFANPGHLNRRGGQVYSQILAHSIDSLRVIRP